MSEQELNLRKYVIRTYVEELLKKLETKRNTINSANKEELDELIKEIYNDIDIFKDETASLKNQKAK